MAQRVAELVSSGDIRDGAAVVDEVVESGEYDSADVHTARKYVSVAFLRIGNPRDALSELQKLLKFELDDLSQPYSLSQVASTLASRSEMR